MKIFICILSLVLVLLSSCSESTNSTSEIGTYTLSSTNEDIKVYIEGGDELTNELWNQNIHADIAEFHKITTVDNNLTNQIKLNNGIMAPPGTEEYQGVPYKLTKDTLFMKPFQNSDLWEPFAIYNENTIKISYVAYSFFNESFKQTEFQSLFMLDMNNIEESIGKKISELALGDTLIYYQAQIIYKR